MENKSFTLIELLVVIAIIGLLSSVVLVSMGGLGGKARVSKGLEFSQSLLNVLGSEGIGRWQFESIAGGVALDSSGYSRSGTVCGTTLVQGVKIDGSTGNALDFDGLNDMVYVASGLVGSTGWSDLISERLGSDTWYHIAMVLTGVSQKVEIYLNGKLIKNVTHSIAGWVPSLGDANIPLSIGTLYPYGCGWGGNTGFSFDGKIDEVSFYEKSLSSTEIQKHYVEGLKRHKDLVIK